MYEYHNNILSIPAKLLYEKWGLMAYEGYQSLCRRKKLIRTKQGRGQGNEAFVSFRDLPMWIQEVCIKKLGDPDNMVIENHLEKLIVPDPKAVEFYSMHRKPNGKPLTFEMQLEKTVNAQICNAIRAVFENPKLMGKVMKARLSKAKQWENISEAVNHLSTKKWDHTLPGNPRSLQRRYDKYIKDEYWAFIHKGEGSKNARKVTADLESLIVSLYCLPNKPYIKKVCEMYQDFLLEKLSIVDINTGELFNPSDFQKNGKSIEISEATCWNYLNKPENKAIISKYRDGDYHFAQNVRPHVNRTRAQMSMSKISLDDRDIGHTKLPNGKTVKAYYAFDTMSTAMIGISHSQSKDSNLYIDCLKSMFRFTSGYGLGVPMQMEVEHHLVSSFKDGLMLAGNIFPFVRWCNPTNSNEKRAERFIGAKKYGVEKDNNQNVGRFYARGDSNRTVRQKIYDEENDNYVEAKASFKEIVAQDLREQIEYNNEPHPDKERFKGKTRLEVFLENVNPDLPEFDKANLARYIGEHQDSTIRRNQYFQVQYKKWQISSPEIIQKLAPNNYKIDAYYIPEQDGTISEVYMYQNGVYICTCEPVPTFNEANAEWTEADEIGYQESTKYISQFDKMVKEDTNKIHKLTVIKNEIQKNVIDSEVVEIPEEPEEEPLMLNTDYLFDDDEEDILKRAFNDL